MVLLPASRIVMSIRKSLSFQKSLFCYVRPICPSWLPGHYIYKKQTRDLNKVICNLFCIKMESDLFEPPQNLHGMTTLDKEAFNKSFKVLSLEAEDDKILHLQKHLKKYTLRIYHIKPIQPSDKDNLKKLLFNPLLVKKKGDFDDASQKLFQDLNLDEDRFTQTDVNLTFDNYSTSSILKAVLPLNEPPLTSFSRIGHIIHVNIKPNLLEYKNIIGQILHDTVHNVRTVVNKTNKIDNVYRNFEMELLCGEPDYIATVKENGISFKFDFSKVYWNPRLSTEHSRVVDSLEKSDVLFDVFCGVGPFSVPAAKKKCVVYANDLNPESIKWLNENIKLNKIASGTIHTFNKDGCDFICTDVKMNMIRLWKDKCFNNKINVVMNLPVLGLDFLKCFKGLFKSEICDLDEEVVKNNLPLVHCYSFAQSADELKDLVYEKSQINLDNVEHSIHFVRNVALTKNMYKVRLQLQLDYMISDFQNNECLDSSLDEPKPKRICKND